MNQHSEIGDEIRSKQDEFNQLVALGEKMYSRQPSQDTQDKINLLGKVKVNVKVKVNLLRSTSWESRSRLREKSAAKSGHSRTRQTY